LQQIRVNCQTPIYLRKLTLFNS